MRPLAPLSLGCMTFRPLFPQRLVSLIPEIVTGNGIQSVGDMSDKVTLNHKVSERFSLAFGSRAVDFCLYPITKEGLEDTKAVEPHCGKSNSTHSEPQSRRAGIPLKPTRTKSSPFGLTRRIKKRLSKLSKCVGMLWKSPIEGKKPSVFKRLQLVKRPDGKDNVLEVSKCLSRFRVDLAQKSARTSLA